MTQTISYIKTEQKFNSLQEECYILATTLDKDYIRDFLNQAFKEDKIVLFFGDNAKDYAKTYQANGIIIDQTMSLENITDLTPIRKSLGKDAIIGLITRNRRHETMLTAELEPDFIIFKAWQEGLNKTTELLSWYNDFFLIQSAVFAQEDIDTTNIPADFIIKTL